MEMVEHVVQSIAECLDVARWHQHADLLADELFWPPATGSQYRDSGGHGLGERRRERLTEAGHHEEVRIAHELRHLSLGLEPVEGDLSGEVQVGNETFVLRPRGSLPHDVKMPVAPTLTQP